MKTLLIAAALSLLGSTAFAHEYNCGPKGPYVAKLATEFSETKVNEGITPNAQYMLEIYASPTGTFTVLISNADGVACVIASGTDYGAPH